MKLKYVNYLKSKHKKEMKRIYLKAFPKSERFPFWILKFAQKKITLNLWKL